MKILFFEKYFENTVTSKTKIFYVKRIYNKFPCVFMGEGAAGWGLGNFFYIFF